MSSHFTCILQDIKFYYIQYGEVFLIETLKGIAVNKKNTKHRSSKDKARI